MNAVSFVGSTPIAEYVQREGVAHGKRVQALGGAKNHLVMLPDADIDQVCDALLGAAYGSAGERCMAISVAVAVGDATADRLVERARRARAQVCASIIRRMATADMGPLITGRASRQGRRTTSPRASPKARAWWSMAAGSRWRATRAASSSAAACSISVTPAMKIYREEIFGPVLVVVRVPTLADAVKLVNSHEFANGTAVFTRDGGAARAFVQAIEVGMVGVNVPIPVPMAFISFGGWRRSSFSDHAMHGMEGVRFYTRLKTVTSRWPEPSGKGAARNSSCRR